jgi:hypothetical protein
MWYIYESCAAAETQEWLLCVLITIIICCICEPRAAGENQEWLFNVVFSNC